MTLSVAHTELGGSGGVMGILERHPGVGACFEFRRDGHESFGIRWEGEAERHKKGKLNRNAIKKAS